MNSETITTEEVTTVAEEVTTITEEVATVAKQVIVAQEVATVIEQTFLELDNVKKANAQESEPNYCLVPIECCNINMRPKSFHHQSVGIASMFCCSPAITLLCMSPMIGAHFIYAMIGLGSVGSAGLCYASDFNVCHCISPCFFLNLIHDKR